MSRVRISTTVDGERLEQARRLLGLRDSELFDRALSAAVREATIAQELAALERFPYAEDPEIRMPSALVDTADALAYDDEIPAHVRALAKRRRATWNRAAKP